MTKEEAKGRLESFIDTFNICKEHDNALVAVSISKEDIQAFTQAIKALEQQEKTGKWINDWEMGMSKCSICGETYLWEDFKGTENFHFCPNCGARMVSE